MIQLLMKKMMKFADIVKVSDEEAVLLTGEDDYSKGAGKLLDMGPKLVAVTLGSGGVLVKTLKYELTVSGFKVNAVDTTGAGDSFWGGFVGSFIKSRKALNKLKEKDILEFARYGNATASICVQRRGGIPAIPKESEVIEMINLRAAAL